MSEGDTSRTLGARGKGWPTTGSHLIFTSPLSILQMRLLSSERVRHLSKVPEQEHGNGTRAPVWLTPVHGQRASQPHDSVPNLASFIQLPS